MNSKSLVFAFAASTVAFALVQSSCAPNDPVTHTNASNASASRIAHDSRAALHSLYAQNSVARHLGKNAKAVLVFPSVAKGGFIFGAEGGNGALIRSDGSIGGYYQTASASFGLQAGVEKFSYAVFVMNSRGMKYLDRSEGWEIGASPDVVVVDRGVATSLSTTTAKKDIYVYFFNQRGLMAGLTLEGTKITRIHPKQ